MFVLANPNPEKRRVIDCTVRAISIILDKPWLFVYDELCEEGRRLFTMPSDNEAWDSYLRRIGFQRQSLPNTCPSCYTIRQFSRDFQNGEYLVATGDHVVAVIDGDYYDAWDSGDETAAYFYSWRN